MAPKKSAAPLIPDEDAESRGYACLEKLMEQAQSSLVDFRKKLTDDPAAPVGLWMYDKAASLKPARTLSASDYFLLGLATANMIAGRENIKPNFESAVGLLLIAHDLAPKNAAILVFAAYLKKQLGDAQGSQALIDQVNIEDMKFDTYEIDALFHAYKHITSSNDLLNFFEVREEMPVVDPSPIKKFLIEEGRQDVGYLMVQNELDPESRHHTSPDGDIIFFSTGRALIREVSLKEYNKLPETRHLMEKMKDHIQYKLVDISNLGQDCDPTKLQPHVDYFRELAQ